MAVLKKLVEPAVESATDFLKSFYKKTYYHFSPDPDIKEFKVNELSPFDEGSERGAIYFTSDPEYAEDIMEEITQGDYDDFPGMSTYPVKIKKGKIFNHKNKNQIHKLLKSGVDRPDMYGEDFGIRPFNTGESPHHGFPTIEQVFNKIEEGNFRFLEMPRIQKLMKDQGYRGYTTSEPGTVGLFYPEDIRSTFAKFDPKKSKSGNILAAVPVATSIGALSMLPEETRR